MTVPVQTLDLRALAKIGALARLAQIHEEQEFLRKEFPDVFNGDEDVLAQVVLVEGNHHVTKPKKKTAAKAAAPDIDYRKLPRPKWSRERRAKMKAMFARKRAERLEQSTFVKGIAKQAVAALRGKR